MKDSSAASSFRSSSLLVAVSATCWNSTAALAQWVDLRLALWNSLAALVELTDHITLRHPAHALYHCRSPYVPILTAVTLYHAVRHGAARTALGLLVALVVGNLLLNVYFKVVARSFALLGLPLPPPPFHCDLPVPESSSLPLPPLTSFRFHSDQDSFNSNESENGIFTGTSESSSSSRSYYEYVVTDDDDERTVATTLASTTDDDDTRKDVDELHPSSSRDRAAVLLEIRDKVERCHEHETAGGGVVVAVESK